MATRPSSQRDDKEHSATHDRPWKVIATELAEEQDGDKIIELSQELNEALEHKPTAE